MVYANNALLTVSARSPLTRASHHQCTRLTLIAKLAASTVLTSLPAPANYFNSHLSPSDCEFMRLSLIRASHAYRPPQSQLPISSNRGDATSSPPTTPTPSARPRPIKVPTAYAPVALRTSRSHLSHLECHSHGIINISRNGRIHRRPRIRRRIISGGMQQRGLLPGPRHSDTRPTLQLSLSTFRGVSWGVVG